MTENEILAMPAGEKKFDRIMNLEDADIKYSILSRMKEPEYTAYCKRWCDTHPIDWSAYGIFPKKNQPGITK